jgi:protein-S-isoprenylcysteine O-methyltransferase Ste14
MDSQLLVTIVYNIILYGALLCAGLPIMFFSLWSGFSFWKKHVFFYYFHLVFLFLAVAAGFYFSQHLWIYWYYSFPSWVQIIGLLLIVVAFLIIKLAELTITFKVRFFYPLLKDKSFHLKMNGIYKVVRHPMYAIFPWFVFGSFLYTGQLIIFPVFIFVLLTRSWFAKKEESYLQKIMPGDYEKYMKQTPNRFYPKFF